MQFFPILVTTPLSGGKAIENDKKMMIKSVVIAGVFVGFGDLSGTGACPASRAAWTRPGMTLVSDSLANPSQR